MQARKIYPNMKSGRLVVVAMFVAALTTQILFRVFFERGLTAGRAEVVGFPLVLGHPLRRLRIHFHLADWIDFHEIVPP